MKRILIIEDERMSASRLKRLICDIDDTLDVVGPLTTVDEVVEALSLDNNFDLIISDIRLHDRLVFEAFHEVMPHCMVIFTTAYDEYALEAFRNNGIDYLLKPIEQDALYRALDKALKPQNLKSSRPNLRLPRTPLLPRTHPRNPWRRTHPSPYRHRPLFLH